MDSEKVIKPDSDEGMTREEKAAADRVVLYATHKARGSLGTYYQIYADERPPEPLPDQNRERGGRDR